MKAFKLTVLFIVTAIVAVIVFHKEIITSVLVPQYIAWAHETEKQGQKVGVPLSQRERQLAIDIGIQKPELVRIIYVDEVPFPHDNFALKTLGEALGFVGEGIINNAQVFGYSIYVRHGFQLDKPKLAHELVHVLQIERSSLDEVVTQHFADMSVYSYEEAPLEAEAFLANEKYKAGW